MRYLFVIIFLLKLSGFTYGQVISVYEIDSLSRRYYLTQDLAGFSELINRAEAANKGMYVMYLRHAITLYDLGKFSKAIVSFNKALEFDAQDKLVLEYLYYCYLLTGNVEQAEFIVAKTPPALLQNLRVKNSTLLNSVELLGGYFPLSSLDLNLISQTNTVTNPSNPQGLPVFASQNLNKDMGFGQITVDSKVYPRWIITNLFSAFSLNKQMNYKVGNRLYPNNYTLLQYDFAHLSKLVLNKNWMLNIGYHFCYLSFDTYSLDIKFPQLFPVISSTATNLNNHLFNIGVHKSALQGFWESNVSFAGIGGSGNVLQFDFDRYVVIGRKGNLFADAKIAYLNQSSGNNFVFNPRIGYWFSKNYVSEFTIHYGSLMNYREQYGLSLFNIADNIKLRIGLNQYLTLLNKISLGFYAAFMQREGYYYLIYPLNYETKNVKYTQFSFAGSVRYKF